MEEQNIFYKYEIKANKYTAKCERNIIATNMTLC